MAIMDMLANKKVSPADTSYWQRWLKAQKKPIPKTTTVNKPASGQLGNRTNTNIDRNRLRRGTAKQPAPRLPEKKAGGVYAGGALGDVAGTDARQQQNTWLNWFKKNFGGGMTIPYSSSAIYGRSNLWQNPFAPRVDNPYSPGGNFSQGNTWWDVFSGRAEGPFERNPASNPNVMLNTGGLAYDPIVQKYNPSSPTFDPNSPIGQPSHPYDIYSFPPEQLPPAAPQPESGGGGGGYYPYPYEDYGGYGGGGGGGGYIYPSYGGGGYNDINRWYANMVQWNINKPKTQG